MKALLIICDGMGDRRCASLGGRTPLEAGRMPSLDWLSSHAECGIMDPIAPGVRAGSDTAHLAILGYDPYKYYSGRGAYEALGAGLTLNHGDVAFRCNFASLDSQGRVVDRRAGRISGEEAQVLTEALQENSLSNNVDFELQHTVEHRSVLILRGPGFSRNVSDVDVHNTGATVPECRPLDNSKEARRTANVINEFVRSSSGILEKHEVNSVRSSGGRMVANAILPRGAGVAPELPSITEKFGIKAVTIAGGALYKGVSRAAGFEIVNVKGATGTMDTNLEAKMMSTIEGLRRADLVFLHVKGTDTASHNKDVQGKVTMIRKIGKSLEYVLNHVDLNKTYIALTADHTTPAEIGEHSADPVPIAIYGHDVRSGGTTQYDEAACSRGALGRIRGLDVMPILMNYLGRTELFGE